MILRLGNFNRICQIRAIHVNGVGDSLSKLSSRNLIKQITEPNALKSRLDREAKINFYFGIDPTADSLHVGHMQILIGAALLMQDGHNCFAVIGDGTAIVGDPSGRTKERQGLTSNSIVSNTDCLKSQVLEFFKRCKETSNTDKFGNFEILQNSAWLKHINFIDFIQNFGTKISVQRMIERESIKGRLRSDEKGLTFAEMSYQLLQGYDFYWLNKHKNVCLQIGGSDQYGNIVSGIDIMKCIGSDSNKNAEEKKQSESKLFGLTLPLILAANGRKFGKSEGNAVWLDPNKTSPVELYDYFLNTPESYCEDYLKRLTLLSNDCIDGILKENLLRNSDKRKSMLVYALARAAVSLIHGESEAQAAETFIDFRDSSTGLNISSLTPEEVNNMFKHSKKTLKPDSVLERRVLDVLRETTQMPRSSIISGIDSRSFKMNGQTVTSAMQTIQQNDLLHGRYVSFQYGANKVILVDIDSSLAQ